MAKREVSTSAIRCDNRRGSYASRMTPQTYHKERYVTLVQSRELKRAGPRELRFAASIPTVKVEPHSRRRGRRAAEAAARPAATDYCCCSCAPRTSGWRNQNSPLRPSCSQLPTQQHSRRGTVVVCKLSSAAIPAAATRTRTLQQAGVRPARAAAASLLAALGPPIARRLTVASAAAHGAWWRNESGRRFTSSRWSPSPPRAAASTPASPPPSRGTPAPSGSCARARRTGPAQPPLPAAGGRANEGCRSSRCRRLSSSAERARGGARRVARRAETGRRRSAARSCKDIATRPFPHAALQTCCFVCPVCTLTKTPGNRWVQGLRAHPVVCREPVQGNPLARPEHR